MADAGAFDCGAVSAVAGTVVVAPAWVLGGTEVIAEGTGDVAVVVDLPTVVLAAAVSAGAASNC